MRTTRRLVSRVALSALVAASGPVLAQQAPSGNTDELDTIVVTAERREASIQDVPISITALTGQGLREAGVQGTEGLANVTPGLIVQRSVVGKISIRGVGNENYTIAGDPGVAVHTDGVYIARASAGLFDLFDVERVEVLRGPQGTLYGRNATGGVINIINTKPDDETGGYATVDVGNWDRFRAEGALNVALGDNGLSARVSGLRASRKGFTRNLFPGADARGLGRLDNQDLYALRGQLAYDGGADGVKARLVVEYMNDDSNLPPYKYLNQPTALPTQNYRLGQLRTVSQGYELAVPGASRGVGTDDDIFKTNQFGAALHLDIPVGALSLKSITGYRKTDFNWVNDGDGADIFYVNYIQQDSSRQYSQEVQLASPGGEPFDWIVGAFWFKETGDSWIALPFTFGAGLPFYIEMNGSAKTDALAAFGELNFRATDRLKFTVGARFNHEKRSTNYVYDINFGSLFRQRVNDSATYDAFTPRFVINYEASDDVNLYASATRGFKSGGFNLLAVQPGFRPEKVWSFEGGIKSELGGIARVNANIFYMTYSDMQVGQIVNLSSVLTNAAKSRLYGAEAEVTIKPAHGLELGGTAAYLNAKFEDFCTGDPTKPTAPVSPGCTAANPIQLKDNTLPRAPEWTLTANAAYTLDTASMGSFTLRADWRYQSKTYFTQFNRPLISQNGYAVVNGRLTWTAPSGRYDASLWVNNAFDRTYFTEVLESGAFNPQLVGQAYVAPPRTWGVSLGARF